MSVSFFYNSKFQEFETIWTLKIQKNDKSWTITIPYNKQLCETNKKEGEKEEGKLSKSFLSFVLFCLYYPQPSALKITHRRFGAFPAPSSELKKKFLIKTLMFLTCHFPIRHKCQHPEKLFISIFTIVFFSLGNNVSLW